jgi:hypothetical protein
VQRWLRRLALLLGRLHGNGNEPGSIPLRTLNNKLPLPPAVLQWYRSVECFVTTRRELTLETRKHSSVVQLVRSCHRQLLEEAERAGLTEGVLLCWGLLADSLSCPDVTITCRCSYNMLS